MLPLTSVWLKLLREFSKVWLEASNFLWKKSIFRYLYFWTN